MQHDIGPGVFSCIKDEPWREMPNERISIPGGIIRLHYPGGSV